MTGRFEPIEPLQPCCDCGEQPRYRVSNGGWNHSYVCASCDLSVPVRAPTQDRGEPEARKLWNVAMERRSSAEEKR